MVEGEGGSPLSPNGHIGGPPENFQFLQPMAIWSALQASPQSISRFSNDKFSQKIAHVFILNGSKIRLATKDGLTADGIRIALKWWAAYTYLQN